MLAEYLYEIFKIFSYTSFLINAVLWFGALIANGYILAACAYYFYPNTFGSQTFTEIRETLRIFIYIFYGQWIFKYLADHSLPIVEYLVSMYKIRRWQRKVMRVYKEKNTKLAILLSKLSAIMLIQFYRMKNSLYVIPEDFYRFIDDVGATRDVMASDVLVEAQEMAEDLIVEDEYIVQRSALFDYLMKPLENIGDMVSTTSIANMVVEPKMMENFILLIGVIYFFFIEAIYFWNWIGLGLGPIAYAISTICLLGAFIVHKWLGDPFNPERPLIIYDHEAATNDLFKEIAAHIDTLFTKV